MVIGKVRRALKRGLTIALAAAVMATSVPQLAATAYAQENVELVVDAEASPSPTATSEAGDEETAEETDPTAAPTESPEGTEGDTETEPEVGDVSEEENENTDGSEVTPEETPEEETTEEETTEETEDEEALEETEAEEEKSEKDADKEVNADQAVEEEVAQDQATEGTVVYTGTSSVAVKEIDFSALTEENWGVKKEVVYAYTNDTTRTVTKSYTLDAKVTIDAASYATLSASESNYLKFQGIVKLGDGWDYTKSDECVELKASNFKADEDNYTADIQLTFTDKAGTLMEIDFEIVGVGFKGSADISSVVVTNAEEAEDDDSSTSGTIVYQSDSNVSIENVDFSALTEENWGVKKEVVYAYTNDTTRTVTESYTLDAKVTIDATSYATLKASESNYIKLQGIVKLGDNWDYTKSDACVELKASDFTVDGEKYTSSIQLVFTDKAGTLMEIDFELVGVGFVGTVNVSNVTVTNKSASDEQEKVYEVVVYESENSVPAEGIDFSALTEENWGVKKEVVYAYTNDATRKVADKYRLDAKITINATAYATLTASESNYLKFQGIVKLGDDWAYTKSDACAEVKASDFTADGDNYTANIQLIFTDKAGTLMEIDFEIVGVGFVGTANISNVKVTNITTEQPELEEKDPSVLSDLSTETDYNRWTTETGWDYYHGGTANSVPVLSYDSDNQRLRVSVDYSANSSSTWSEAKAKFTPDEAVDVSQYNQLSVDFIYPDELDGTKMKFFADGVIEKDTAVDESAAEDLGNGMKKVTVSMTFSPSTTPLESVTIGIIGVSTSFKGDVYLDNLVLSQKSASEDFVEITSTPGTGSLANIANAPTSVKISDASANESARALFAYLQALSTNDQVLFGHQNDVNRSVRETATLGDVYDVTGQVSGLFGIDTLSLTGSEAGGTDAATALKNSVAYSKKAAENGAIVTLSAHMPNVSNSKVEQNADGSYDFFQCDFSESKDLSNDIAKKILPGGEYNVVYTAYLDIIVDYAKQLQAANIPIIFRPLHENTGNWFWWGSSNTAETYKSLYRYTKDYIESQGVHNMLWVYSPNGPLTSEAEYLTYYPGDEYVDILAFDYYDDYNTYPATSDGSFFTNLNTTCGVVSSLAAKKGKIAAISETGVRVMKKDGSDNEGLLVTGNPVGTAASGTNWYSKISEIANDNNMPYYLVWANFSDTNFYVPYKYSETYGHELINDFIDFYNEDSSIFGADANFYDNISALAAAAEVYTNQMGYMVSPFDMDTILEATTLQAVVKNAEKVQFVITNGETKVTIDAVQAGDGAIAGTWSAALTDEIMAQVGKTEVASITLMADDVQLANITNIAMGTEKVKAPAHVLENFDYYSGSNGLLDASYTTNSAAGCSSSFTLSEENKVDGNYGGAFNYTLVTTGSEVWTGRIKSELVSGDFSAYNAIEMWVKPDGNGQKLVIQLADKSGEEFEAYLTDFVKGTEAQYVTIPFSSFKGKQNGTLDTDKITKFAIWCNSIDYDDVKGVDISSTIYFDGIQAVSIDESYLSQVDENGLIITDESIVGTEADEVIEGIWVKFVNGTEYTYTGKAIKPAIEVYDGETLLTKKDYSVSYENNTKAGEATVIVKGKGNYTGKDDTTKFIINPKDLGDKDITAADVKAIIKTNGTVKDPAVTVKMGKTTLKAGRDYTLTMPIVREPETDASGNTVSGNGSSAGKAIPGKYDIVITGTGNFTGTKTIAYTVVDKKAVDMKNVTVELESKTVTYGEDPVIKSVYSGKGNNKVYYDASQYEVEYPETQVLGSKNVLTVKAIYNAEDENRIYGTKTVKFTVTGATLTKSNVTIALDGETDSAKWSYAYTGEEIKPVVAVTYNIEAGYTLTEGTDFTATYSKNTSKGTAKVKIKGIGAYSGSITKEYKITKATLTDDNVSVAESVEYSKSGAKAAVVVTHNGKTLTEKKDYTVSYADNKAVGTAKVTIKGKNNFEGTVVKAYQITDANVTFTASDVCVTKTSKVKNVKPTLTVVETATNKKLANKTDYTKDTKYYSDPECTVQITNADVEAAYAAGEKTIYAKITLKGKYGTEVKVAAFRLYTAKASTFKVAPIEVQTYTGKAVEPKVTVYANDGTTLLTEGVDYEIVSYSNNVKVSKKATVTIKGVGNGYGGTKTVKFEIKKQSVVVKAVKAMKALSELLG